MIESGNKIINRTIDTLAAIASDLEGRDVSQYIGVEYVADDIGGMRIPEARGIISAAIKLYGLTAPQLRLTCDHGTDDKAIYTISINDLYTYEFEQDRVYLLSFPMHGIDTEPLSLFRSTEGITLICGSTVLATGITSSALTEYLFDQLDPTVKMPSCKCCTGDDDSMEALKALGELIGAKLERDGTTLKGRTEL